MFKPKLWLKAHVADRALRSLRDEIIQMINSDSRVLDVGCGTGDLLFKAAHKIQYGLGVDIDEDMITFANRKCKLGLISHLTFEKCDLETLELSRFDVSTSTLCLHEMSADKACRILSQMAASSERVLIADYTKPKTMLAKIGIEIDEMVSGHYQKFRQYREAGAVAEYVCRSRLRINRVIPSSIDGIAIWDISV